MLGSVNWPVWHGSARRRRAWSDIFSSAGQHVHFDAVLFESAHRLRLSAPSVITKAQCGPCWRFLSPMASSTQWVRVMARLWFRLTPCHPPNAAQRHHPCFHSIAHASRSVIALILIASLVLHMTSVSMTLAAFNLEIVSNLLIVLLGCWLVSSKIIQPARARHVSFDPVNALMEPESYLVIATPPAGRLQSQASNANSAKAPILGYRPSAHPTLHHHHHDHDVCDCGHAQMPDTTIAAGSLDWRKAWTVVASTALRPAPGTLIVLVFSISQGLWLTGIAATLLMGSGTAITVTFLAALSRFGSQVRIYLDARRRTASSKAFVDSRRAVYAILMFGMLLLVKTCSPLT